MIIHAFLFFALGSKHHNHLAPFKLRLQFDLGLFSELVADAMHDLSPQVLVGHFTAAITQRDLGLVAIGQEATQSAQLGLVIIFVSGGT